jgi:threonine dehydratase
MDEVSVRSVARAAHRLTPLVRRTPLEPSRRLSAELDVPVLLKREDLQLCRSYKVRGAYNLILSLGEAERRRGVVCASAGNHGQGVAYSCREVGMTGRVYLPAEIPLQKRERIAAYSAGHVHMVLVDGDFDDAELAARRYSERTGAILVHPFDAADVVAGQGTVAVEIVAQLRGRVDTVVVPVGGGGLVAGMLLWLKERLPRVHVVGAEPAGAASMAAALAHGAPVRLPSVDPFVDGAAVPRVGRIGHRVVMDLLDELVQVPEDAVCAEIVELHQTDGIIAEPAGALASAAVRLPLRRRPQGTVVCVLSGGNNDIHRYGEILRRARAYGRRPRGGCAVGPASRTLSPT